MDKEDVEYTYIHTHNGILLSHKKNKIMPFATTWMNLAIIILSEVSQTKTNILHIDQILQMIQMNLFAKQK